jgi:hypothetical protein
MLSSYNTYLRSHYNKPIIWYLETCFHDESNGSIVCGLRSSTVADVFTVTTAAASFRNLRHLVWASMRRGNDQYNIISSLIWHFELLPAILTNMSIKQTRNMHDNRSKCGSTYHGKWAFIRSYPQYRNISPSHHLHMTRLRDYCREWALICICYSLYTGTTWLLLYRRSKECASS